MTISTTHRTSSESLRDHFDPFAARAMSDVNVWNFCQERFVNLAARAKVWGANSLKLAWQSLRNWLEIVASWSEKRYSSIYEVDSSLKSAKLLKAFGVFQPVWSLFDQTGETSASRRPQRVPRDVPASKGQNWSCANYHFRIPFCRSSWFFSNYPRSLKCPIAVRDYSDTCSRR